MAASTSRLVGACSSSPGTYADPGVTVNESTKPLRPTRRRRSSSASSLESTIIPVPLRDQASPPGLWTTRPERCGSRGVYLCRTSPRNVRTPDWMLAVRKSFEELVDEAAAVSVEGWDFSWLDGRATEERPSWG